MSGRSSPPSAFEPTPDLHAEPFDPLRLCVYTTIGVLAWLLTPAVVAAVFSGVALVAYAKARRAGLAKSRCKLGDTRLVMGYLALVFIAGTGYTLYRIVEIL